MDKQIWRLMDLYNGYVDKWRELEPPKNEKICFVALVYIGGNRTEYKLYEDVNYLERTYPNGYYTFIDRFGNKKIDTDIIRIICWGYRI